MSVANFHLQKLLSHNNLMECYLIWKFIVSKNETNLISILRLLKWKICDQLLYIFWHLK